MAQIAISIPTETTVLSGILTLPDAATGLVILAHGVHGGRDQNVDRRIATALAQGGLATLAVEMGSGIHDAHDMDDNMRRHAIHVFGQRLVATTDCLRRLRATSGLPLGYFGVDVGAAAACAAAVARSRDVACLVSWQGRLDLVGRDLLAQLRAPTLVLVGDRTPELVDGTRCACTHLTTEHCMKVMSQPDAGPLAPAVLDPLAAQVRRWFQRHFQASFPLCVPASMHAEQHA